MTSSAASSDFVVGLGGSAGSIRAFREFFRHVPPGSGMAYVVILHLSPDHESRLAEVLQGAATIPVTQVRETVKVEPDHVYVIPPNHSMTMSDGTLTLSEMAGPEERRAPVDTFFRTLGDSHDSRAVCVVLSGTGADGSMGLRRVKEYNGLALVQDPAEAEFSEMPRNSIATGLVDFILPVAEMPARIMAYREQLRASPLLSGVEERPGDDEEALLEIFTQLRARTGHDFTHYKRATVLRRIERRMAVREIARLSDYARFVGSHREEAEALLRDLLISVTNFFRDRAVWEKLEQSVVPKLLAAKGAGDHLGHPEHVRDGTALVEPARRPVLADPPLFQSAAAADRPEPRMRFSAIELHQRLLEDYAPPSLIVDEQYTIVHLSDRAGRYLQFPSGEASLDLLQAIRPELRLDLRAALHQAVQNRTTVAARGTLALGDRSESVSVVVHPQLRDGEPPRGFLLVLFRPLHEPLEDEGRSEVIAEAGPAAGQMEEELIRVKTQMRITIEQYELQAGEARAANEELQAINEELRSTAEELETSQEELQSVNEELRTVNQELKIKIDEISHASDDMRNLMSSTEIGTIFVDRALRVKLFTPRVRDVFNLIPSDVGRPLFDISSRLKQKELAEDLERVLERLQPVEREVETTEGRWYMMRVVPYRTVQDRIDGVVVTFIDITERRHAEEVLRRSREELEELVTDRSVELRKATGMLQAIIDSSPIAIVVVDTMRRVLAWNPSAERMFGISAGAVVGRPLPEIATGTAGAQRTFLDGVFAGHEREPYETLLRRSDGTWASVSVSPAALRGPDGTIYAVMGLLQDITDRKRLEQERERLLRRVVEGQEEERQRIARELHDELGQHLTALRVGIETIAPPGGHVDRMKEIVRELDRSVDRLTLELRPPVLDDVGLHGAIASLIDQFTTASGIHGDIHTTGTDGERLPPTVETALYRVVQEALTNVWKHAGARNVSVILERHSEQMQLIVEDDGRGFEESDGEAGGASGRFGLLGIRERVALLGGSFSLESSRGKGTTLYVRVPLGAGRAGA